MEIIGDYRLLRLLGEGGMGKVYEAEEKLSKRRVALKVLRPELSRNESARRMFTNEMAILADLDHPNVVRAFAFREIENKLVMVLELLEGRTLRSHLCEFRGADPAWAVSVIEQIAGALAAAHEHDPPIVHRDLKPENVMVLASGSIKVTDFGIAKVLAAAGNTTTHSVGTLAYMSPEQIDAGAIDARSDLYCLGLLLYELLAGRPPFESSSPRELLNLQCTAAPPALPEEVRREVPRGLERLLFELLEKSPERRPASARAVLERLEPFSPAERHEIAPKRAERAEPKSEAAAPESSATPARETTARPKNETALLIEQACAPRDVPLKQALSFVVAAALVGGLGTWFYRAHTRPALETRDVSQERYGAERRDDRYGVERRDDDRYGADRRTDDRYGADRRSSLDDRAP